MKTLATLFIALAASVAMNASPSLIGSNATINYLFPTSSNVYSSSTVTVTGGVEVTCPGAGGGSGVCPAFAEPTTIDIGATSIVLKENGGSNYSTGSFNGVEFSGLDFGPGYNLSGFTLVTDLPGLVPADVSFTDNSIEYNGAALAFPNNYTVELDLTASTPEPATVGLFGLLSTGLGLWKLRSRRRAS